MEGDKAMDCAEMVAKKETANCEHAELMLQSVGTLQECKDGTK